MSSQQTPRTHLQQQSTFKKWLPAILLALVIHALLLIVFFQSQKQTTHTEPAPSIVETSAAPEDLEREKEVLLTLIEERSTTTEQTDDETAEELAASEKEKVETQDKEDLTKETNSENSTINSANTKSTSSEKESAQTTYQKQGSDSKNISAPPDNTVYATQPIGNPNDAVLLPRDLPQAELNSRIGNNSYAHTAQQSQDLSDQLSSAVNEIKEQKLREIEAQQQASKAAYLKSLPSQTQTKNSEPSTSNSD